MNPMHPRTAESIEGRLGSVQETHTAFATFSGWAVLLHSHKLAWGARGKLTWTPPPQFIFSGKQSAHVGNQSDLQAHGLSRRKRTTKDTIECKEP
jgi:hypothetical protein